MDGPDIIVNNPQFKVLKEKVSHLTSEIFAPDDVSIPELKFSNVVDILKNEIESFNDLFSVEATRKQQLLDEDERLLKYIREEEDLIACILEYLQENSIDKIEEDRRENWMDKNKVLFFKLETMHRQIIILLKKISKRYFPAPANNMNSDDLFLSKVCDDAESIPKKSLLDIFSELVVEMGLERNCENDSGILHIDDTIPQEYINMLLCADIVERIPEDPSYVMLK